MPVGAQWPELLPLVGHGVCLLHDTSRVHQPSHVRCMAGLLIGNGRFCRFLSFTLVGLERGASTQISPADSIAAGMAGRAAQLAAQV